MLLLGPGGGRGGHRGIQRQMHSDGQRRTAALCCFLCPTVTGPLASACLSLDRKGTYGLVGQLSELCTACACAHVQYLSIPLGTGGPAPRGLGPRAWTRTPPPPQRGPLANSPLPKVPPSGVQGHRRPPMPHGHQRRPKGSFCPLCTPALSLTPTLTLTSTPTRSLVLTLPQGCVRREGAASEAAPEAVRQAVGGGCQSGWGRLLSVTNAIEAGTCRQGDSGWA